MIHRIMQAPGSVSFSAGRVSHILIGASAAFAATDYLTVNLNYTRPGGQMEVIINRVSLLALQGISDFEAGASQSLQVLLNAGLIVGDYIGFTTVVDIGNLDLPAIQGRLDITIEGAATITSVSLLDMRADEHSFHRKVLVNQVMSDSISDCEELFMYNGTATIVPFTDWGGAGANAMSIMIDGHFCTTLEASLFTAVMGEIEAQGPTNIVCIYRDDNPVPRQVAYQITGTPTNAWSVICISKKVDTVNLLKQQAAKIREAEARISQWPAEKQAAFSIATGHPISSQLVTAHAAVQNAAKVVSSAKD